MRLILITLCLFFGSPVAMAAAQDGPNVPDKAEVEYHEERFKDVQKLAEQLTKAVEKGKDTSDTIKALRAHYLDELAALRAQGIETKVEEPLPKHPQHLDTYPETPPDQREKLLALRDLVVDIKGLSVDDKPKVYQNKLNEYVQVLSNRYERKKKRFDNAE